MSGVPFSRNSKQAFSKNPNASSSFWKSLYSMVAACSWHLFSIRGGSFERFHSNSFIGRSSEKGEERKGRAICLFGTLHRLFMANLINLHSSNKVRTARGALQIRRLQIRRLQSLLHLLGSCEWLIAFLEALGRLQVAFQRSVQRLRTLEAVR